MRTAFLLCALLISAPAPAEDAFLRELAVTRGYSLGRPTRAEPAADGSTVLFLRAEARSPVNSLYAFDVESGQSRVLITPEQILKGAEEKLSQAEKAQRERQRISTRGFSGYQLSEDGKLILVTLSGKLYVVRRADNDVTGLKTGTLPALNPTWSPDATSLPLRLEDEARDAADSIDRSRHLQRPRRVRRAGGDGAGAGFLVVARRDPAGV